MIVEGEKSYQEFSKMVKSKRELGTPRRRNSLLKNRTILKTSRPASAASSVPATPAANIRVVVRVRPPTQREQSDNARYKYILL